MSNHFYLALAVCVYVFYMFGILIYAFKHRKRAVVDGKIDHKYFKAYSGDQPEFLRIIENHINNQFQLPPIFMVTVVLILSFSTVSIFSVVLAWLFVVTRFIHSYVHLGKNKPLSRAKVYMIGWLAVFALWIQIMIHFANI